MECQKCRHQNPEDSQYCAKCGQELALPLDIDPSQTETLKYTKNDLTTGSTFAGRYNIIEELGRGGMGRVYRARDTELEEEVAIKLINPEISSDRAVIDRFKREIKLARKISHKNVGRVHEMMEHGGTRFITMEYVPGEDLKSFIRRAGRLSPDRASDIARQIAEGLAEAHRLGVIHRDLKPQNIIIDRQGNARILDFGIAKSLDIDGQTSRGAMIGTPGYMSPEQISGGQVDERADLYSLGAILFEMLTRREPFTGDTPLDVLLKQKSDTPPDPASINPQIPAHLRSLVLHCLEKAQDDRCPSTKEFLNALSGDKVMELAGQAAEDPALPDPTPLDRKRKEPASEGRPTSAEEKPSSPVITQGRKADFSVPRKDRLLIPFFAALFFALLAAGYFLFFQKSEDPGTAVKKSGAGGRWQNSIAVLPFRDLSPQKDQANLAFGMTDAINDRLARLSKLKVIATTSVVRFRDTDMDIKEIGRELGVAHILEGTLQVEGEQIRVRAQLINAETGFHLWSDTYERKLDSIFDVQDEVSSSIAEALEIELTPEVQAAFKNLHPRNMEAYKLFLHGMNLLQTRFLVTGDEEDFRAAESYLQQAVDISPNESIPYGGLAWAHAWRAVLSGGRIAMDRALEYNRKALEINPESGEVLGLFAYMDHLNQDYEAALHKFEAAFKNSPNSPSIYWTAAVVCRVTGLYDQSRLLFDRGQELNPMQPYFPIGQAQARFYQGDFKGALPYFIKNIALTRNISSSALNYINCLIYLGRIPEADNILDEWKASTGGQTWWSQAKAIVHAARGEREEALATARFIWVYAMLGMKEEALDLMEQDISDIRTFPYLSLINLPVYDSLRSDPRFQRILAVKKAQHEELLKLVAWVDDL